LELSIVSQGRIWTRATEAEYLLEAIESAPTCDGLGEVTSLTKRETSVAELTGQGLSNKQIAHELGISEHTVTNHLFHIFDKLHVANRVELLFLMVRGRHAQYGELAQFFWGEGFNLDAVRAAAEEGFLAAQFMLGLAHLEGRGAEKDDRAAYHWLRLAEMNSSRLLEQSRSEISELKSRIPSEEIAQLEQRVSREAQEPHRLALQKPPAEVQRQDVRASRVAC
jgi:DNA-binding CsgD family transcriptional regulator